MDQLLGFSANTTVSFFVLDFVLDWFQSHRNQVGDPVEPFAMQQVSRVAATLATVLWPLGRSAKHSKLARDALETSARRTDLAAVSRG
jgi:hypothetical protein